MKKIWLIVSIIVVILVSVLTLVKLLYKDNNLTKVKVVEVTHSIFYAPQYVAHALGYFEDEGLDVELILVPGVVKNISIKKSIIRFF